VVLFFATVLDGGLGARGTRVVAVLLTRLRRFTTRDTCAVHCSGWRARRFCRSTAAAAAAAAATMTQLRYVKLAVAVTPPPPHALRALFFFIIIMRLGRIILLSARVPPNGGTKRSGRWAGAGAKNCTHTAARLPIHRTPSRVPILDDGAPLCTTRRTRCSATAIAVYHYSR
jgi:hypothetical protein